VINSGSDGDTAEDALRRLERDVLSHRPRGVIVLIGGNDVLRRNDRQVTLDAVDRIVARCAQAGAIVVLVHGKYGLFDDPYRDGFEQIAAQHNALLVKHALKGILGNPSHSSDQIHPNDAGYALLAERVAEAMRPLLEAADEARR
jgi:lysophospholipase L1-like esterase